MRKIPTIIILLVVSSVYAGYYINIGSTINTTINTNSFAGNWSWIKNDSKSSFNLKLSQENDFIKGTHCITAMSGGKIDCTGVIIEDEISIKGYINKNIAYITFKSEFSDGIGEGQMKLLDIDTIEWEITKNIKGENYFPEYAILKRQIEDSIFQNSHE